MEERTITLKELKEINVDTFSRKDNSPRGIENVSLEEIKPGDEVVIDNYFTLVTENKKEVGRMRKRKTIRLSEILDFVIQGNEIETVEFYNDEMTFLYKFPVSEIPLETQKIKKFNIYQTDEGKRILEVIEAQ